MNTALLDTNIFIRHLVKDHLEQTKKTTEIFDAVESGKLKGIVSLLVVHEVLWVLERYYLVPRKNGIPELIKPLLLEQIHILEIKKEQLIRILQHMQITRYDFTDLYLFYTAGERKIISFDKDFEKLKKAE